ncbi:MAG: hypothetical protein ACXWL5_02945 [Candidatus Chromulinivorax sp.]
MVQIDTKIQNKKNSITQAPYTYNEIVAYFDKNWQETTSLTAIAELDKAFNFPSQQLVIATVSGTSGKSTTINYTSKLLQQEGLKIGAFYAPHIVAYNERFVIDNEQISNKLFTDLANKVVQTAQEKNINASTKDFLTIIALLFFKEQNVDLAVFENTGTYALDPVLYCNPDIAAVTRIVSQTKHDDTVAAFTNVIAPITSKTYFVSADQNKQNLHIMHELVEKKGSNWLMPIRKLAPLAYPFEQLHGRCAALAERIAYVFINNLLYKNKLDVANTSLLSKPKNLRGRPTLESKKAAEIHAKKSLEQFWNETSTTLPFRFELQQEHKTTVLLDNANNLDALNNLFLGFRLLAYKNQYKNASLILGCYQNQFEDEEFIKQLRYFTKKATCSIAFCPIKPTAGENQKVSWDAQKIAHLAKAAKIKVKAYKNFTEAFTHAKPNHDDQQNLIIIAGSQAILTEYMDYKAQK